MEGEVKKISLILFMVFLNCTTNKMFLLPQSESRPIKISISFSEEVSKRRLKGLDSVSNIVVNEYNFNNHDASIQINILELKWYCPKHSEIQGKGFAVGFFGGLIGVAIWGEKNFTDIYGISHLKALRYYKGDTITINVRDTVKQNKNYNSYATIDSKNNITKEVFSKSLMTVIEKIKCYCNK